MKTTNASTASVLELRRRLLDALPRREQALVQIIDALTVGPRIKTPSELALSPLTGYQLSSLYTALRSVAEQTPSRQAKQRRGLEAVLKRVRRARREWLDTWSDLLGLEAARVGPWRVHVLDATCAPRPKAETVRRTFAHSATGMQPGHALSVLSLRVERGSWTLPLELELVPVGQTPAAFGASQIVRVIGEQGWEPDDLLCVDADYTKVPVLRPMVEAGANLLGRISARRVLYEPPGPYSGRGRPRTRGRKITLSDGRTLPDASAEQEVKHADGRRFEISRYDDVRMRAWPEQPMTLYRVIEYRADGTRRYKRPLWLLFVGAAQPPSCEDARDAYGARFSIEHAFRFVKGELGLVSGQFNGEGANERFALWAELVGSAFWQLYALRSVATSGELRLPGVGPGASATPGAVRRASAAIFARLGITAPTPRRRGKSPGRAKGTRLEPRHRFRIFRKRKGRKAA
jgi:hypothetical protein